MQSKLRVGCAVVAAAAALLAVEGALAEAVAAAPISLATAGATYQQNFVSLASSGTSSTLPAGFALLEVGGDTSYAADTGSLATGDTYSYGPTSTPTERALGVLRDTAVGSTIGAEFQNNTGAAVTRLTIAYTGEQWRLGATGRTDRLDFQYSTDATSLGTGTWTDADALDFTAPITAGSVGALDGDVPGHRRRRSLTVTGLYIPAGATFWFRWQDLDATGNDDGLAVDDLAVIPESLARDLPSFGTPVTENFDTLASSGLANTSVPPGFAFSETGAASGSTGFFMDGLYKADNGTDALGNTFSYGAAASPERALGTQQGPNEVATIGLQLRNATGATITKLAVAYTGEQWRHGSGTFIERLDFQLSTDAVDLTSGTWTDVDPLDFVSPISTGAPGALDGNAAANRSAISSTITGLSIPAGATFWIRWKEFGFGSVHGLAVDNLSVAFPDGDGDGVENTSDNCPSVSNPSQADADGDGVGDACDPDVDGDGAPNASDNCASLANASQSDVDADGLGDACDPVDNRPTPPFTPPSVIVLPPVLDLIKPIMSAYGASPGTFRAASSGPTLRAKKAPPVGTTLRYTLSEAAFVLFTVQRRATGRKVSGKCVAPKKSNLKKRRCTRFVAVGSFSRQGKAGANSVKFTGRVGGRKLSPGSYRLVAVAIDAARNKSAAKTISFKIVR
jgi:hypothetical protein